MWMSRHLHFDLAVFQLLISVYITTSTCMWYSEYMTYDRWISVVSSSSGCNSACNIVSKYPSLVVLLTSIENKVFPIWNHRVRVHDQQTSTGKHTMAIVHWSPSGLIGLPEAVHQVVSKGASPEIHRESTVPLSRLCSSLSWVLSHAGRGRSSLSSPDQCDSNTLIPHLTDAILCGHSVHQTAEAKCSSHRIMDVCAAAPFQRV